MQALLAPASPSTLGELERRVETALVRLTDSRFEAARCLIEIRDRKLYTESHATFAMYVEDRWGKTLSWAYRQLKAVDTFDLLVEQIEADAIELPLPTCEAQTRPLSSLPAEDRVHVWHEAVEDAEGEVPTAAQVREVVERRKLSDQPGRVVSVDDRLAEGSTGDAPDPAPPAGYLVEASEHPIYAALATDAMRDRFVFDVAIYSTCEDEMRRTFAHLKTLPKHMTNGAKGAPFQRRLTAFANCRPLPQWRVCAGCEGSGKPDEGSAFAKCGKCRGAGYLIPE